MKTTILVVLTCILLPWHTVFGQTKYPYPIVGDTLPDHTFYDLINYREKTASISDFKGKWLVIDFWAYSCSGCLKSFPKMNRLHNIFKDKIQFIMVGITKTRNMRRTVEVEEAITKNTYSRLDKAYKLDIPVAFDSVLDLKHSVGALPQILIIDPKGVLRVKAVSVDSVSLADLLEGKQPQFERSYSYSEPKESDVYNFDLPFLTNGTNANGGPDTSFLFRSLLSHASPNTSFRLVNLLRRNFDGTPNTVVKNGRLEAFNSNLGELYRLAYFGMNYWESQDSAYGKLSENLSWETKDSLIYNTKNAPRFTYSLIVPKSKSSKASLMSAMQKDLQQYFGYNAKIERRSMPVYTIRIIDTTKFEKMLSKGIGKQTEITKRARLISSNEPFKMFVTRLAGWIKVEYPLIDKTGVDRIVNIEFDANKFDRADIEKKLMENGLELILATTQMDVIVVTD